MMGKRTVADFPAVQSSISAMQWQESGLPGQPGSHRFCGMELDHSGPPLPGVDRFFLLEPAGLDGGEIASGGLAPQMQCSPRGDRSRGEPRGAIMNSDRLARFRDQFIELSRRTCGNITSADNRARMPAEGDAGTAVSFEKPNTAVLENEESLREDVLNALRRVDEGTYGRCELCGQDIIEERVDVLPFTRFCTTCRSKRAD